LVEIGCCQTDWKSSLFIVIFTYLLS
jgi:hypothetical protein